ncbi:VanZ family protein [Mucilaginibacter terrae]|uniref:VanZ family protein n=1 Tax=Mucilaginibacter terrae TaxID=1955052 RepID=UPI0036425154
MAAFFKYQKLTLGWALFILVMCNINTGKAGQSPLFFPGFDKLVHCGFFFMFTALILHGVSLQRGNLKLLSCVKAFVIAMAFGALIEILQIYIFTWRSGEWNDLFADTVGAGMAAFSSLITATAVNNEKN